MIYHRSDPSVPVDLREMLLSYRLAQAIFAGIQLGILDVLRAGPRQAVEIAEAVGANWEAMKYLLRVLATAGIINRLEGERYDLGILGKGLLDARFGELISTLACYEELYAAWSALPEMVKTGRPAFELRYGMTFWNYLETHPKAREQAATLVTFTLQAKQRDLLKVCDFTRFRRLIDVGGAHGTLLRAILDEYPHLFGLLFDLPEVISDAREAGILAGVEERCDLVAGDFFREIPKGGDVYLLSRILHDWDDRRAEMILANCFRAMERDKTLIVIEKIPCAVDLSAERVMSDLKMFILFGSHERTQEEYTALLNHTGFRLEQIIPTGSALSIIEATRI